MSVNTSIVLNTGEINDCHQNEPFSLSARSRIGSSYLGLSRFKIWGQSGILIVSTLC